MRDFWACAHPRHCEDACVAGMGGGSRREQKEVRETGSRSWGPSGHGEDFSSSACDWKVSEGSQQGSDVIFRCTPGCGAESRLWPRGRVGGKLGRCHSSPARGDETGTVAEMVTSGLSPDSGVWGDLV